MRSSKKSIIGGIVAKVMSVFVPIQKKHWVFASNYGKTFGEGARNMMLYVLEHDRSINCTYITKEKDVYKQLKAEKVPCELNWSIKGILAVLKSDTVFFTHSGADIDYTYKIEGRRFYYLPHGQSYKVAQKCLKEKRKEKSKSLYLRFKIKLSNFLMGGLNSSDSDFISCCSDFIAQFTRLEYNDSVIINVLGSPRNDILFTPGLLHNDFYENFKFKTIITYMPTHRGYGSGELSPNLFINNSEYQQWLREHNVVILIKQHPNMIQKIKEDSSNDVIVDITKLGIDPQSAVIHSDIMITDYSSVWIDWLLFHKPLLHYVYDNFAEEDVGFYYDLHDDPAGEICETEQELFEAIKKCILSPEIMQPTQRIIDKYHKYQDGRSCERHYEYIMQRY